MQVSLGEGREACNCLMGGSAGGLVRQKSLEGPGE